MNNNGHNSNEQQWKLLVLLLKEIAIEKHGVGYQLQVSKLTGFTPGNVSRMFSLKYAPSIKNFIIIAKALKVNFFFEDQESKTDLNIVFERAMETFGRRQNKLPKN